MHYMYFSYIFRMDKILESILKSNHSERFKQQLIEKVVISTAAQPQSNGSYLNLLKMAFNMVLYSGNEFDQKIGMKVGY